MRLSGLIPFICAFILAGCEREQTTLGSEGFESTAGSPPVAAAPPAGENSTGVPESEPDPSATVEPVAVENPYFPLEPGTTWTYEGTDHGQHRRDEVSVLFETREIDGTVCTAIHQEVFLDGALGELTTEWFALDDLGNVWKYGEETLEIDGGELLLAADSWIAGVGGGRAWMFLPADPRVGDFTVGYKPGGADTLEVLATDAAIAVPAGLFTASIKLIENGKPDRDDDEDDDDEEDDSDIILYAPNVGLVSEQNANGRIDLVGHSKK